MHLIQWCKFFNIFLKKLLFLWSCAPSAFCQFNGVMMRSVRKLASCLYYVSWMILINIISIFFKFCKQSCNVHVRLICCSNKCVPLCISGTAQHPSCQKHITYNYSTFHICIHLHLGCIIYSVQIMCMYSVTPWVYIHSYKPHN